jgi:hypothetical protein
LAGWPDWSPVRQPRRSILPWDRFGPSFSRGGALPAQPAYGALNTYVLLSPYPDQSAPVTATAWGVQLTLDNASDDRLPAFLRTYVQGEQPPSRARHAPAA